MASICAHRQLPPTVRDQQPERLSLIKLLRCPGVEDVKAACVNLCEGGGRWVEAASILLRHDDEMGVISTKVGIQYQPMRKRPGRR